MASITEIRKSIPQCTLLQCLCLRALKYYILEYVITCVKVESQESTVSYWVFILSPSTQNVLNHQNTFTIFTCMS